MGQSPSREIATRPTRQPSIWRSAALLLILCLPAALAFAQPPDATIRRIVDLNVQAEENRYLSDSQQIDRETSNHRRTAINDEVRSLYRQIGQLSPDAQRQAKS